MKAEKSISLGVLQDQLEKQRAKVDALRLYKLQALAKLRAMESLYDRAEQKHEEGIKVLDALRQSVLSTARTVANG